MKKWMSLFLVVVALGGMFSGCGFFGESSSEKKVVQRESLKMAQGLKGPVKQVSFSSPNVIIERAFSVDGTAISRLNKKMTQTGWESERIQYDHLDREILFEKKNEKKDSWSPYVTTIYDDKKREYRTVFTDEDGKILAKFRGELDESLRKKKNWQDNVASVFIRSDIWHYKYNSFGALIRYEKEKEYLQEYQLDDQHRVLQLKRFGWNGKAFEMKSEEVRTYGENGAISLTQSSYYKEGKVTKTEEIKYAEYELDSQGNWIKRTVVGQDGKTWLETRTITYWE